MNILNSEFSKVTIFLFSKALNLTFNLWILVLIIYFIILCDADKSLSVHMVITIATSTSGLILSAVILLAIIFVHQSRKKMLREFMKSKYYPRGTYFHSLFYFISFCMSYIQPWQFNLWKFWMISYYSLWCKVLILHTITNL